MRETQGSETRANVQKELELLEKARDELKLQMHLAKADIKTEWAKLEATWQRVSEQMQQTRNGTEQPIKDIGAAARSLFDELRNGYARIREQLKERQN